MRETLRPTDYPDTRSIAGGSRHQREPAHVVRIELEEELDRIIKPGNLRSVGLELVEWTQSVDRVDALSQGALSQNPNNDRLDQLARDCQIWVTDTAAAQELAEGDASQPGIVVSGGGVVAASGDLAAEAGGAIGGKVTKFTIIVGDTRERGPSTGVHWS